MNMSGDGLKRSASAGTELFRVKTGTWDQFGSQASAIRFEVFVNEQRVPLEEELDAADAQCLHALAIDATGDVIGTGRLLPDGHIGRMAVLRPSRGKGAGAAILLELIEQARSQGFLQVVLSAQTHAKGFYAKYGFTQEGEEYMDANIAHILMRKTL
ncbi:GNAT family N-acetyltransferase [Zwartia hollandica]|jgi:predicted GNAT family N-acyltransferase|nr:GNAT family N-acetyltransferase [Zwartia hollandica]